MRYKVIKDNAVAYNLVAINIGALPGLQEHPLAFNPVNAQFIGVKSDAQLANTTVHVICGLVTNYIIPGTLPPQYEPVQVCFLESDVEPVNENTFLGFNVDLKTILIVAVIGFIGWKIFKRKK